MRYAKKSTTGEIVDARTHDDFLDMVCPVCYSPVIYRDAKTPHYAHIAGKTCEKVSNNKADEIEQLVKDYIFQHRLQIDVSLILVESHSWNDNKFIKTALETNYTLVLYRSQYSIAESYLLPDLCQIRFDNLHGQFLYWNNDELFIVEFRKSGRWSVVDSMRRIKT